MSAREELFNELRQWMHEGEARELIDAYAHELAEEIQDAMEETQAADWGKSTRSKRPYLQGMERAKKVVLKKEPKSG